MTIDRRSANVALSKAIAYKNVGNNSEANKWAIELVRILECADILSATNKKPEQWEDASHFGEESADDYEWLLNKG